MTPPTVSAVLSGSAADALDPLAAAVARFLSREGHRFALRIPAAYRKRSRFANSEWAADLTKDTDPSSNAWDALVDAILAEAGLDWSGLVPIMQPPLQAVFADAGTASLGTLEVSSAIAFDQVNTAALAYAEQRAAELVGMKLIDGVLVVNPDAAFAITETTRAGLRSLVQGAFEDGLSPSQLAAEIRDSYLFSKDRSTTIARTELARAQVSGTLSGWAESGVVAGSTWILGSEHVVDDPCDENDGVTVSLGETFPSGAEGPPEHPACTCGLRAVLAEQEQRVAA